ncbi:ras-related protein Rab-28-like isoform X2 [Aricia agestis]|uniref:ras-related protein Rab-28-like isoform X2 n=1 Tax=Aricia agestis TaxID=91739 RepID=UPI001C207AA0|nr:ras-related protein Rab-28-like isoform X2 [Aricia agestis]
MSDTDDEESVGRSVKFTLVGEPLTGKSTLCHYYLGGGGVSGSTHGAEVMAGQCFELRPPVPLQLCDVAGNTLHTSMLENYLYGSDVILFVYDLTNLQSFEKLNEWFLKVRKIVEEGEKKPIMALFGNKTDLEHQRAVRISCVQKFASEYLLEHFKGSAKTGEKVNTTFTSLVARALGIKAPAASPYNKTVLLQAVEAASTVPVQAPAQTLIMNRKALRKLQRNASSSVCCVQ